MRVCCHVKHSRQAGQSLTEYLAILAFALLLLMLPLENGLGPFALLRHAINDYYTRFTYAVSLPTSPVITP